MEANGSLNPKVARTQLPLSREPLGSPLAPRLVVLRILSVGVRGMPLLPGPSGQRSVQCGSNLVGGRAEWVLVEVRLALGGSSLGVT